MSAANDPDKTSSRSSDLKSAIRGIRGAGDAIRGTAMEAVDSLTNSKEGQAKNRAIAEQGAAEAKAADQRFGERRAQNNPNLASMNTPTTGAGENLGGAEHVHGHRGAQSGHTGGAGLGHATSEGVHGGHVQGDRLAGQEPIGPSGSILNSKIAKAGATDSEAEYRA